METKTKIERVCGDIQAISNTLSSLGMTGIVLGFGAWFLYSCYKENHI